MEHLDLVRAKAHFHAVRVLNDRDVALTDPARATVGTLCEQHVYPTVLTLLLVSPSAHAQSAAGSAAAQELFEQGKAALAANDSYAFWQALGDDLVTGPTGTNVNDLTFVIAL